MTSTRVFVPTLPPNTVKLIVERDDKGFVMLPSNFFDPVKYKTMSVSELMSKSSYWGHINSSDYVVNLNPDTLTDADMKVFQLHLIEFLRELNGMASKAIKEKITLNANKENMLVPRECANQQPMTYQDVLEAFRGSRMVAKFQSDPQEYCDVLFRCVWSIFESGEDGDDDWMMEVATKFCQQKSFSCTNLERRDVNGTRKHCLIRLIASHANVIKQDFSRIMERAFKCTFRTKLRKEKVTDETGDEAYVTMRVELQSCKDQKRLFYLRMSKVYIAKNELVFAKLRLNTISAATALNKSKEDFLREIEEEWDQYNGNRIVVKVCVIYAFVI